jgi:2,4-dienoyl-CoA reductase-like NADH-dependent reductase (Old Yellow Enzyme family)
MKISPNVPISFPCGTVMKNRFMLAPLTNTQSYEDGQPSTEEIHWLTMRAKGQFGLVMTCASHVQEIGKGFPGQMGIFSDEHISGHQQLTTSVKSHGSLAVIQLHHAGMRSPGELIHQSPVCPSNNEKHGARGLTLSEIRQLRDDFVEAAIRAKKSGYDGVEVHGAHGYILTQFLSQEINLRTDEYGGNLVNRSRLLFEIIEGIRQACGRKFLLGVRLSPERFGMDLQEVKEISQQLIDSGHIDFLDISMWDCFKQPEEESYQNHSLLGHFTQLDFKDVRFTVAGKIGDGKTVNRILEAGVDFVTIGRSAILHHDFPEKVIKDPNFTPVPLPVTPSYLNQEGLSENFINYMRRWPGFVSD